MADATRSEHDETRDSPHWQPQSRQMLQEAELLSVLKTIQAKMESLEDRMEGSEAAAATTGSTGSYVFSAGSL